MAGNRKNKKRRRFRRVFFISLIIFAAIFVYGYNILNKMDSADISKDDTELGITDESADSKDVVNIALFGLDRRDTSGGGRSDSVMIASLDKKHKKIKLTSLMRDTYIDIPGRGMDKLNHAYSFGGPELAIRTINQNFNMNIREFATVDFFGLEKIIDVMGGVEIDVKSNEVKYINTGVKEMDRLDNSSSPLVQQEGTQLLTGRQAVSYSRIRKTGNGDYERTERQRVVLEQVLKRGMNAGITKYPALLNAMLPYVETSLSKPEILSLGTSVLTSGIRDIDQYRIPADGYVKNQTINGVSYVVPQSLEDNVMLLNKFIYEDEKN
ncbi:MAG: LCP family protein [Tissierellia bacterium]|nr:LCP family protein [Tissierellia bacterium]